MEGKQNGDEKCCCRHAPPLFSVASKSGIQQQASRGHAFGGDADGMKGSRVDFVEFECIMGAIAIDDDEMGGFLIAGTAKECGFVAPFVFLLLRVMGLEALNAHE